MFTLGSTSAVTGELSVTLPVAHNYVGPLMNGGGRGNAFDLLPIVAASTVIIRARRLQTGTNIQQSSLSSTVPLTWATSNYFEVYFTYPAG